MARSRSERLLIAGVVLGSAIATMIGQTAHADTAEATTGSDTYQITTWNQHGSNHPDGGNAAGRAALQARFIKGYAGTPKSDVVLFQEVTKHQWDLIHKKLPGYALFPPKKVMFENVIAYDKSRFSLVGLKILRYPFYGDKNLHRGGKAPVVRLRDKRTGQLISVEDQQSVAWNEDPGSDPGGAKKRLKTAQIVSAWAVREKQAHPKGIRIAGGDTNSTNYLRDKRNINWIGPVYHKDDVLWSRDQLWYCVMTKYPDVMQNAEDMAYGRSGHCPNQTHSGDLHFNTSKQTNDSTEAEIDQINVDQLEVSPKTATVSSWKEPVNWLTRKASDHYPLTITVHARH